MDSFSYVSRQQVEAVGESPTEGPGDGRYTFTVPGSDLQTSGWCFVLDPCAFPPPAFVA